MDALTALKDEAARYRWEMITREACEERRRERRALMLERIGNYAAWAIMAAAVGWIVVPMVAKIVARVCGG